MPAWAEEYDLKFYQYIYSAIGSVTFIFGMAGFFELINRILSAIFEKLKGGKGNSDNGESGETASGERTSPEHNET